MNGKQLYRVNRAKYISLDGKHVIEYFIYRGGKSEWIISERNSDGFYFSAVDHAPTLEEARAKYLVKVGA
jgi:hypothetical protein